MMLKQQTEFRDISLYLLLVLIFVRKKEVRLGFHCISKSACRLTRDLVEVLGCGGIMRVAPCGLFVHGSFSFLSPDEKANLAFRLGCLAAAVTHTHPSGWLSSGCQAAIISRILSGMYQSSTSRDDVVHLISCV